MHEAEPTIDRIDQYVQNVFKGRDFYDQMEFDSDHRLPMTQISIELIGMLEDFDSEFIKRPNTGSEVQAAQISEV